MHGKGSLYYKDGTIKYKGNFKLGVCEDESKNFDDEGNEKCMSDKFKIKLAKAFSAINKLIGENKNNDIDNLERHRNSVHDMKSYTKYINSKFENDSDNDDIFAKEDD